MILPDWNALFNFRALDCRSHVNGSVAVICGRMYQIHESVRRVYAYNLLYVEHQVRRVYEAIQDLPIRQRTRTARGVLTDILSRAMGLASQDDLKGVENILEQIQKGVLEASRLWGDGAKSLSAAFKIEQDRMRNVFGILSEYRQEIRSLQHRFVLAGQSFRQMSSILTARTIDFVSNNTRYRGEVDALYNAVQHLMAGNIPHFFNIA